MTQSLILSQLTKSYRNTQVLHDVSLNVDPGERVALLGHNGAGKSTMMKIILGLISFNGGEVRVLGAKPGSPVARAGVAYLPENAAFHSALTGLEQIRHYLRLRGQPARLAGDLLDRVGLADAGKRRIGTYSKGMRQRIGLAQALIGKPRLLVLDEPTSGLDPVSRRDFYALLDDLAADGASVLLSSHALTEVEARTDRLVILSQGRLVTQGTLSDLRRQAALPIKLHVTPSEGQRDCLAEALPQGRMNGTGLHLSCAQDEKLSTLSRIAGLGGMVRDIEVTPPSLEDIYSHFSRRDGQ
ncbi:ABC transporter ATP-binding protein [Roseovarius sp. A21]|uniref:ABC transporter ATP-binding protein n=1 Tax=Roseovarius bejariae TaxID=2576383 RepID=A0A844D3E6_9RHOB|nr:ABC transporter ATP-binding protein [Roseovarius bejariae]MRU15768.1 ABC transporter ATP-binding protein [Roseovarius bejariae]